MGNVHCSIPTQLADSLRQEFELDAFVETGLGQGTSALWAEKFFDFVVSIEIDRKYIDKFKANHPQSKVQIVEGDSAIEAVEIARFLNNVPALFWLDAHTDDYTPVLLELAAINASPLAHVIMIDDARMFDEGKWPSTALVMEAAWAKGRRDVRIVDDVIVATPRASNAIHHD